MVLERGMMRCYGDVQPSGASNQVPWLASCRCLRIGTARFASVWDHFLASPTLPKIQLLVFPHAVHITVVPEPDFEVSLNTASWFGDFSAVEPVQESVLTDAYNCCNPGG